MDPNGPGASPPAPDDRARVEELEKLVSQLMSDMIKLRDERDKAVRARDAILERVIPLASPGRSSVPSGTAAKANRVLMLLFCVLLLLAVALMAHHFPRIVRTLDGTHSLPPSVRVQSK